MKTQTIMNSSKLTVISNLRPFLLLLVIINHCTPVRFTSYVNGGDFEMLNMLQNLFGHILTPSATGLFFLISGFLYFYRVDQFTLDVYKVKSSKRVKTLVVPYLVWCTISASYEFLYQVYQWHANGYPISFNLLESLWCCHLWGEKNLNILGWSMPMYGPADLPLWFLRDLIVVSFCIFVAQVSERIAGHWYDVTICNTVMDICSWFQHTCISVLHFGSLYGC